MTMTGLLSKVTRLARSRTMGARRPGGHAHRGPVTPAIGEAARGRNAGGGLETTIRRFMRRGH